MTTNKKKLIQSNTSCVFFHSNNTKTCTIDRLIQRIQLLACNLDTEFAMLCTMYYLLYGSEFFSDSFFLQEYTVLLYIRNLKKLINPEKLILNLYSETGSVKLSAFFPLQNGLNEICWVLSSMFT